MNLRLVSKACDNVQARRRRQILGRAFLPYSFVNVFVWSVARLKFLDVV